jgi:hypothetical protein
VRQKLEASAVCPASWDPSQKGERLSQEAKAEVHGERNEVTVKLVNIHVTMSSRNIHGCGLALSGIITFKHIVRPLLLRIYRGLNSALQISLYL